MNSNRNPANFFRWGILQKTALAIMSITVMVGAISILATMAVTHERAKRNAARELGELLDTVESTVRIACFAEDGALAAEVVRGLLKNSKVQGVTIRANDRVLARSARARPGIATNTEISGSGDSVTEHQLIRRVTSPFNLKQTVGEIALDPDTAAILQQVDDDVRFAGLLLAAQWAAIGGSFLVLILLSVVRPIKKISDCLHRMDAVGGEQLASPIGHERTEIGRLVEDINALAARLVAAIAHATEQTRQLQYAKEKVDAQARQLDVRNAALARTMQVHEEVERIARHDLKTPLNSIAVIPSLLRKKRQPSEDEEALLSMIENSARRVLRMVSLSLDLFRMEEGAYVFQPKAVDVAALVRAVMRDLADEASSKSVDFQFRGHAPEIFAHAEEILCYSILANLIKNAVEAAPERSTVDILLEASDRVRVSIHNEGAVPLPVRAAFFEKYATHGKNQGNGLGTYSALLMARVQRGELTMETSGISGTTLRLALLPLPDWHFHRDKLDSSDNNNCTSATSSCTGTDIAALSILLVDDDPGNMLVMKAILPDSPLAIETACNGREALDVCRLRRPDFIFMDLEMPVMGGFEALKQIRALQRKQGESPSKIIAFSAHDDETSRLRSIAAGFDLHLSKPSSQSEIAAVLGGIRLRGYSTGLEPVTSPETPVSVDVDLFEGIPAFLQSRRELMMALRQALEFGERESVRRLAHKLKGSFGLYGFKWAAQLCGELEQHFLTVDTELLVAQVNALEQHLTRVEIQARTHMPILSMIAAEVDEDVSP